MDIVTLGAALSIMKKMPDTAASSAAAAEDAADRAEAAAEQAEGAIEVDDTLSVEGRAADAAETGKRIEEANSRLHDVSDAVEAVIDTAVIPVSIAEKERGTTDMPDGVSTTSGYLRHSELSNAGNLSGTGSATNNTFWMLADSDMDVYVEITSQSGGNKQIGVFEGSPYGASNLISPIYAQSSENYPLPTADNPLTVKSGQYVTFSYYNGSSLENSAWVLYKIEKGESVIKPSVPLTTAQREEVNSIVEQSGSASESLYVNAGWENLPLSGFARKGWTTYTTTDNRAFRIHYIDEIAFERDVFIQALEGFYFTGYSDGTYFDTSICRLFKAGTKIKLTVRRRVEDTSETADIETFAKALLISTPLAQMERLRYTYTDISMFERVGIGGDSYAAGGGIISGVTSLTWGKNLERQSGVAVDIYAKSGETIVGWNTDTSRGLPALLAGEECGLYWLAHGINGTSTDEALGTAEDMSANPRPNTFYGQYVEAIEQIKTAFPNARIVIQTITGSNIGLYYSSQYAKVNTAIKAIAEYCEIPVIDVMDDEFYRCSPVYASNMRSNHPTALVAAGMAQANRRLMAKCILENTDYFITYGT